jgi:hypothetical protein
MVRTLRFYSVPGWEVRVVAEGPEGAGTLRICGLSALKDGTEFREWGEKCVRPRKSFAVDSDGTVLIDGRAVAPDAKK